MIRKLFRQFNKSLSKRVVPLRYDYEVPINLTFEPGKNAGGFQASLINLYITGETKDLSKSGIAFIVPSIRLKENYLVGENRTLNAELDLPNGKISMKIVGLRYEQIGKHISASKFLIGAKILQMTDENREVYETFLRDGKKFKSKVFQFGIDES
ncbi:hypothetical protein BH18ACI1_BH18ACI1_08340 [soil metagenome]